MPKDYPNKHQYHDPILSGFRAAFAGVPCVVPLAEQPAPAPEIASGRFLAPLRSALVTALCRTWSHRTSLPSAGFKQVCCSVACFSFASRAGLPLSRCTMHHHVSCTSWGGEGRAWTPFMAIESPDLDRQWPAHVLCRVAWQVPALRLCPSREAQSVGSGESSYPFVQQWKLTEGFLMPSS